MLTDQLGVTLTSFEAVVGYPVSAVLMYFIYLIAWWIVGAFFYHTIHQLRLINRIHTEHTPVDLPDLFGGRLERKRKYWLQAGFNITRA